MINKGGVKNHEDYMQASRIVSTLHMVNVKYDSDDIDILAHNQASTLKSSRVCILTGIGTQHIF